MNKLASYLSQFQPSSKVNLEGITLIETMLLEDGFVPLFYYHQKRIIASCNYLNIEAEIIDEIIEYLKLNVFKVTEAYSKNSKYRIRALLIVDKVSKPIWSLEVVAIDNNFKLDNLSVGFIDLSYRVLPEMAMKTTLRAVYDQAEARRKSENWDDIVVVNDQNIVDSIIGNVVICKGNRIITPELSSGCVAGCMLQVIEDWCEKNEYQFSRTMVSKDDCMNADTLWLVNAVRGIRVVSKLENKMLTNNHELVRASILKSHFYIK